MSSQFRANVLALFLLLLVCAGVSWLRSEPGQPPASSPSPGKATSSPLSNGRPGPESVTFKVLAQPLRCEMKEVSEFLFDQFANQPEEELFNSYTSANWKANYQIFSAALVQKAVGQNLDSASLRRVLASVLVEAGGLAYLPVGAYQATLNEEPVWIVVVKWESVDMGENRLGHIRIYAFSQESLKMVAFSTCD